MDIAEVDSLINVKGLSKNNVFVQTPGEFKDYEVYSCIEHVDNSRIEIGQSSLCYRVLLVKGKKRAWITDAEWDMNLDYRAEPNERKGIV